MGCIPQVLLITLDQYKKVPYYGSTSTGILIYDTNALIKYPYGNTIFSASAFLLYLSLTIIFFWNDKCLPKTEKHTNHEKAASDNHDSPKNQETNNKVSPQISKSLF